MRTGVGGPLPAVQLCGDEIASKRDIAAAAATLIGHTACLMPATALPADPREFERVLRLWQREAMLNNSVLFLDCEAVDQADTLREGAIARAIEANTGYLLIISSRERHPPGQWPPVTYEVHKPTAEEQRAIWQATLGDSATALNGRVDRIVAQFKLNAPAIQAVCAGLQGRMIAVEGEQPLAEDALEALLWDACRAQARPRLDDLAQRIEPAAAWEDLIVPEPSGRSCARSRCMCGSAAACTRPGTL